MNYIVVHSLEQVNIGDELERLPLHMTVVSWFSTDMAVEKIDDACRQAANSTTGFQVYVEEKAMFGPNQDVPVNIVHKNPELEQLHQTLLNSLGSLAVQFASPHWLGEGFRPHVTHKRHHRLNKGDKFFVDTIDLVSSPSIRGTVRTVVDRFELKQ